MDNPEQPKNETETDEILGELHNLGNNLKELLQSIWESEERKKAQKEIEDGLNDMVQTLSQAAKDFSQSPTGQTLKADIEDLQERIETGEMEKKVRQEVVSALRMANEGLKKASTSKTPPENDL